MATGFDSGSQLVAEPRKLFIGGAWTEPSTDSTIAVINPSTEDVFALVAEAQSVDVANAVAAARQAFDRGPWPRMSHAERADFLMAMAEELGGRAAALGDIWSFETGAVNALARPYAGSFGGVFAYYARMASSFPFEEAHVSQQGSKALLIREPVGVVGAIVPWNAATELAVWKIAPALLAGCTIILKASPEAPCGPLVIAEVAAKVGLPGGVLNVITADRAVSEELVRHRDVDKISFTGSTAAGRKIGAICGERIARCTLELGGKSAALVLDDFPVEAAAQSIAATAPLLTGQICASLTRIVVPRARHDRFVDALAAAFSQVPVGDPFAAGTGMGPVAMRRQRDRIEDYIAKGKGEGATLVTGGGRPSHLDRGFFVEPTVFGNVDNAMTIAREEIFGPVLSVIPADDEAHAVAIANDSNYGLNASVFTNDPERANRVARQLRTGTVGHNGFKTDFTIAFGGYKDSGIGREGGAEGLRSYLETKTVLLDQPAT